MGKKKCPRRVLSEYHPLQTLGGAQQRRGQGAASLRRSSPSKPTRRLADRAARPIREDILSLKPRFQAMRGKIRRYAALLSAVGETSWRWLLRKTWFLLVRFFVLIILLLPICSEMLLEATYGALKIIRQY